jgi:hypothetical protein
MLKKTSISGPLKREEIGHWYEFVESPLTWDDAQATAVSSWWPSGYDHNR